MDFSVALAQIHPKLGNVEKNLELIEENVEIGIEKKANLILFPELAVTGYFLRDLFSEVALHVDDQAIARVKALSHHISIAVGFVEASSDYRYFNSAAYFEDGEIKHLHRKVYLPTYGLFDEQRYIAQGEQFRAFTTKFGRMGVLICEDMWHLSSPYILAEDGATTILCLSSSPGRGISNQPELATVAAWQKLNSTVAQFLNCHVLFCNRVGYEDGVVFWGGSEVVTPTGEVKARAKTYEEEFLSASLEEGVLRRERLVAPMMRDENLFITLKELRRIEQERDC